MRKIIYLALILGSILFFFTSASSEGFLTDGNFWKKSVCDKPLFYSIGDIDKRFELSAEQVRKDLSAAETIWEKPTGKNLFEYSPDAKLKVDFVYDRKQALNSQINQLEGQLNTKSGDLEAKKAAYENQVFEFNKKVDELNLEIAKWNTQGGAPPDEFQKLQDRQKSLRDEAQLLNQAGRELNLSAFEFNLNVEKLNSQISQFNADLARRPEEGLFDPSTQTIYIYFVPSQNELEHTLAHELGHALGLLHLDQNPKSIMYPYSSDSIVASAEDTAAVFAFCAPKSVLQTMKNNFVEVSNSYFLGQ